MVRDTLDFALAREEVRFVSVADGGGGGGDALLATEDAGSSSSSSSRFDALLRCGTANNNANARKRYANHGLAYGDYYLVEFGNRLLRMGLANRESIGVGPLCDMACIV
ncbi:hypothetical protein VTK73DRAFT_6272 [Phialemonium thermophilum]|uniref:Uncharacterized protein n=1 Tax=Phialemonium thermophilum TaxID=223376 RepID=A0ABR3UZR1_9PEZI